MQMYENYTRISLPTKEYRELLGSALCVFNSNFGFIIENILREDSANKYNWFQLIDLEGGKLTKRIHDTLSSIHGDEIETLFAEIVDMRNRIIHSFCITDNSGEQILATKTRENDGGKQFHITEEYLYQFIEANNKLSDMLHTLRGY